MTNLEKIRAMTAEELAEFLEKTTTCCASFVCQCDYCPLRTCQERGEGCYKNSISKWLESEVSEND